MMWLILNYQATLILSSLVSELIWKEKKMETLGEEGGGGTEKKLIATRLIFVLML